MKRIILFFILPLFFAPRVLAQDIPARVQEPELNRKGLTTAEQAAEEAEKRTGMEAGSDVTYEQVMGHPDDVDLNYRYALSQVRKGNLRSAAATLERILMLNPNRSKIRLIYAVVLFRLDNLDDAERELNTLKSQKMPETLRAELNEYLRQIHQRRRTTHFNALFGAGFDYDDNRNAAPALGQRLFFDTPITLTSNSTRKSDTAKTMLVSLGVKHDLGFQAGHLLFADYSYYRAEQTNQRILNLQNHAVDAGMVYKAGWANFTPSLEFNHLLLTQTTYMRSRTARLRIERKLTPRFGPFLETAYTRQEYNRTLIVVTGDERTGDKIEGTGGASYVITPTMNLFGSYTHINQGAVAKFDAYRRESFTLGHSWLLGRGQFLLSSAIANIDRYEQPELAVSKKSRRDNTYRARITYGIPLDFITKSLKGMNWTFTYEYYHALSNLRNYSYSNNKLSTLLTYKWGI